MKKWRCGVCKYVHEGDEPHDKCPVCGADKSLFEEIIEEAQAAAEVTGEETPTAGPPPADTPGVDLGP